MNLKEKLDKEKGLCLTHEEFFDQRERIRKNVEKAILEDTKNLEELKTFLKAECDNDGFQKLTLPQVLEHIGIYENQKKEIFGDFKNAN